MITEDDEKIKKTLNSSDILYKEIRDLNIEALPKYFEKKSVLLKEIIDELNIKEDENKREETLLPLYHSLVFNINVLLKIKVVVS